MKNPTASEMGRKGGSVKSPRKAQSSAQNGKTGKNSGVHKARQWQPIKTAPKDGTAVLGWDGKNMATVEYHSDEPGTWELHVTHDYPEDTRWFPIHWMPLPNPPNVRLSVLPSPKEQS